MAMAAPSLSLPPSPSFLLPSRSLHLHAHSLRRIACSVSLQEPLTDDHAPPPPPPPPAKSKNSVWVNPASKRAAHLRATSTTARQERLTSVAAAISAAASSSSIPEILAAEFPSGVAEKDAAAVLNTVTNPAAVVPALHWFFSHIAGDGWVRDGPLLYNVAFKAARKGRNWEQIEAIWNDMVADGATPDNVTFSTVISCARFCNLPLKAVEWFEKMESFGCAPDDVTYSVMIDAYGRAKDVAMALKLYDRARREKWRLDAVTYATVIKIYCSSGNFDGALNVFEEMKASHCKPNLVIYNTLLDAMGKAGRPWQAKTLHREMLSAGLAPSTVTFAALIRAYSKARYAEDALGMYREMKDAGLEPHAVLCNMLLAMCADIGLVDEAERLFEEMKASANPSSTPDSWSYSSLITVYSCGGDVAKAEGMLDEMLRSGHQPNIFVLTSLIQCYGNAGRTDDVVRSFERMLELGIAPDDRFCGCLLNVATRTPASDIGKVIDCIERSNVRLGGIVRLLVGEGASDREIRETAEAFFANVSSVVKKPFFNCMIDLCVNLKKMETAAELLELAQGLGVYEDIQVKSPAQWSLHVRGLSVGAATATLHSWVKELAAAVRGGEELPQLLGINTGHGKHKYTEKGLAAVFESRLKELGAPFHEAPDKPGWFLTTSVAAKAWLEERSSGDAAAPAAALTGSAAAIGG